MHFCSNKALITFRRINLNYRRTVCVLVCLLMSLLIWHAIHNETPLSPVRFAPNQLRSGDILFIAGKTLRSEIVKMLELGKVDYSHVCIVVFEDNTPYVIHADPQQHQIAHEAWSTIVSPERIVSGAVFRINDDSKNTAFNAAMNAKSFFSKHLLFDDQFDLHTPDKLYCTELVWRAYLNAGLDLCPGVQNSSHTYLLPSKLLESKDLHQVCYF